ncbi:9,12-octadecadienoate 8-hydroperoxide 8R-isomerase [Xylogone sp. PMI_703]|nr:9,12-octadecadienoate 8-hydroperoxide 8R-isomerase [Xylogone sp. PMI_703]
MESLFSVKQLLSKSFSSTPQYPYLPANDDQVKMKGFLADLKKFGFRDVETLFQLFSSEVKGFQNDDQLILEHLVQLLAKLPTSSKLSNDLTSSFINSLYNSLPHPPVSSLGSQYKYRSADGSNNNIRDPNLGKANTPYARSAKPVILQNIALPDPGIIFDSLMVRGETFEPHPNKISSMLFYLATIIIHDIFLTSHDDYTISMASSYLDLSPLYGTNQQEQDAMRTFKDGRLKPDSFSSKRILGFPPGVGAFLIMFNRFHNYVVTQLAMINENGRFTKPRDDAGQEAWDKYDNDLFQTGRLVTCGLYANIILKDYVRTILSLNRVGTQWDLDPRSGDGKTLFNTPAPEGLGNQVSAEFNLIYRWHSAISERDEKWTQDEYANLFPGRNPEDVSLRELLGTLNEFEQSLSEDPLQRPFASLQRNPDGTLDDNAVAELLISSVEDVAGSFGANRVPKILRSVEMLGIIQARAWNMATLNEFREFSGLSKHATFEDINPDPAVAQKLRDLYDSPDFVELYPGLVVEKAKPPMSPGSGLCVNFTTSYAILSDAVALVRGDRFYTVDYTPKNLTAWGYNEVQYDVTVDDGAVMYKLFLRALPNNFDNNSVYVHFPFVIPSENRAILQSLGRADQYSWERPTPTQPLIFINSFAACKRVIEDKESFKVTWGKAIEYLASQPKKTYGVNFCLSGDLPANASSRTIVMKALYPKPWDAEVRKFFSITTNALINKYKFKTPGTKSYEVDIVRDVANLVSARFSASVFGLPIKTEDFPKGKYTEQEMYQIFCIIFIAIFFNADIAKAFQVNTTARVLAQQLGELLQQNVEAVAATGIIAYFTTKPQQTGPLTDYGTHMIQRFLNSKLPIKEIVWTNILPTAVAGVANQSQLFVQSADYYLTNAPEYIPKLYELAHQDTPEADEQILRYFLEGARLGATTGLYRDHLPSEPTQGPITIQDGEATIEIPTGRRVFPNLMQASIDPAVFPDPLSVRLDRPMENYLTYGLGPHQCAGMDASKLSMTTMFKVVFGLKNLRKATSSYGENPGDLKKIPGPIPGSVLYMTPDQRSYFPFPTSMKLWWDEE